MKFSLFAHMERFDDDRSHRQALADLVELVLMAEAGGFEAAWIGEHHGMEFTIAPNPFIYLAYLAGRTSRIRLGTGTVVAPFWHPIKLADEAAITDLMTGGRLDVGIARGAYQFEYDRLGGGMDGLKASEMLREIVPAVKGLWAGDYAHQGEHWSFPSSSCIPAPLQRPHPPLWIAARDISSHEFALAQGCNVMVTPLWNPDTEVTDLMAKFNSACSNFPDTPRPRICLLRHTYVASDEADVQRGAGALSRYYCYFGAWFKNQRPISRGFIESFSDAEIAAQEMFAPQLMRANNVVGTPDTVIERLKYYEQLGFDQYSLWIDNGMSPADKRNSLKRFIDEVMPAFQD